MESFSQALLNALDMAIFEHENNGVFKAIGPQPQWFSEVYGKTIQPIQPVKLAKRFLLLANFLEDAAELWNNGKGFRLKSGTWAEADATGKQLQIEATAFNLQKKHMLILECGQYSYKEKQLMLSKTNVFSFDYKMLEVLEHQEQEIRADMAEKLEAEMQSLREEIRILKKRLAGYERE